MLRIPEAGWQSGYAAACKAVYAGSIPTPASNDFVSSMTTEEQEGSSPYRIDVLGDVLRLEVMGTTPRHGSVQAVTTAVESAREHGCRCILFDIRKASDADFHSSVIRHAQAASDLGMAKFRVALVGTPGSPLLKFIEDVSLNRGLPVRCFTDEPQAMRWLTRAR